MDDRRRCEQPQYLSAGPVCGDTVQTGMGSPTTRSGAKPVDGTLECLDALTLRC